MLMDIEIGRSARKRCEVHDHFMEVRSVRLSSNLQQERNGTARRLIYGPLMPKSAVKLLPRSLSRFAISKTDRADQAWDILSRAVSVAERPPRNIIQSFQHWSTTPRRLTESLAHDP